MVFMAGEGGVDIVFIDDSWAASMTNHPIHLGGSGGIPEGLKLA
jgi:hypothetical protein